MSSNDTQPADTHRQILVVRLGAMGDVIHTLPAVARLKRAFPDARITWAIEPRWAPLIEGNPTVDEVFLADTRALRKQLGLSVWSQFRDLRRRLRAPRFDAAVDFQGLLKSAALARLSAAPRIYGFTRPNLREPMARVCYTDHIAVTAAHVVDKNLALVAALGAAEGPVEFTLPLGEPDATLPEGEFVLASPVAGWKSKQWPPQHYARLAAQLWERRGMALVLDCSPGDRAYCEQIRRLATAGSCHLHVSSLAGLITATRRAAAVVGIDSGPLHLAAALSIPGVAIFGPTDPDRNGPYGASITVLRAPGVDTSYKRRDELLPEMAAIPPESVYQALEARLGWLAGSFAGETR